VGALGDGAVVTGDRQVAHGAVPAEVLTTERLTLTPLVVDDAEEMTPVLADPDLYLFTGGEPPTRDQLADRYARQQLGRSRDGTQRWHNWVVRRREDGAAVGYVQATVEVSTGAAEVAWVVGAPWQGRGYATEAATAMAAWLTGHGATGLVAHVHPGHRASAAVARALGLHRTGRVVDGEDEWTR
jgi:RimJ/RimL family protein N-acetyltransferase